MRFSAVLACLGLGAISLALADPPAPAPAPAPGPFTAVPPSEDSAATPRDLPAAAATLPPAAQAAAAPPATAARVEHAAKRFPGKLWTADPYEEHFLAEGYKMELHNEQKMFCRKEERPGSHLGEPKVCRTLEQLKAAEGGARDWVEHQQRLSTNPKNH